MPEAKHQPTLADLFKDYETEIRAIFECAALEIGLVGERTATFEFTGIKTPMLFRSVPSERRVLADRRGIASLWAISHAVARLSPAMFSARRNGADRLDLPEGSPEALGHAFIGYAKDLCVPQQWRWNTYFPKPDRNTPSDTAKSGDRFFFRSLEWILRHELAHIALNHQDRAWNPEQSRAEERDADLHAIRALRGDLRADAGRAWGTKPSEDELRLERRAIAAGMGLIWVGLYEQTGKQSSDIYPPISDRIFRCLNEFGLAADSMASEILSDFIKAWVDPQTAWPTLAPNEATARAAMEEACRRLDEYVQALRRNTT
jgi:hypothetical protein